jgi:hypothetical protein
VCTAHLKTALARCEVASATNHVRVASALFLQFCFIFNLFFVTQYTRYTETRHIQTRSTKAKKCKGYKKKKRRGKATPKAPINFPFSKTYQERDEVKREGNLSRTHSYSTYSPYTRARHCKSGGGKKEAYLPPYSRVWRRRRGGGRGGGGGAPPRAEKGERGVAVRLSREKNGGKREEDGGKEIQQSDWAFWIGISSFTAAMRVGTHQLERGTRVGGRERGEGGGMNEGGGEGCLFISLPLVAVALDALPCPVSLSILGIDGRLPRRWMQRHGKKEKKKKRLTPPRPGSYGAGRVALSMSR